MIPIDLECIEKRRASVVTPNLGKCGNPPIRVMDEKQKGHKICYTATMNPATEEEAAKVDEGAEFHIGGVSELIGFSVHGCLVKFV
jgi:hypothetical protein